MGKWNWWLPKSLDRILPDVDFESDHLAEPTEEPTPATV
jgi:hypothetical protein